MFTHFCEKAVDKSDILYYHYYINTITPILEVFQMKKIIIRVIALAIAAMMLVPLMSGCGGKKMTVKVGVRLGQDYINFKYAEAKANGEEETFVIPQDDRTLINDIEVEINYSEDNEVTVIRAIREACANVALGFETDSAENSIHLVKTYTDFTYIPDSSKPIEGYDKTLAFFWAFTVNGEEPDGRAGTVVVKDGDTIQVTLSAQGGDPSVKVPAATE